MRLQFAATKATPLTTSINQVNQLVFSLLDLFETAPIDQYGLMTATRDISKAVQLLLTIQSTAKVDTKKLRGSLGNILKTNQPKGGFQLYRESILGQWNKVLVEMRKAGYSVPILSTKAKTEMDGISNETKTGINRMVNAFNLTIKPSPTQSPDQVRQRFFNQLSRQLSPQILRHVVITVDSERRIRVGYRDTDTAMTAVSVMKQRIGGLVSAFNGESDKNKTETLLRAEFLGRLRELVMPLLKKEYLETVAWVKNHIQVQVGPDKHVHVTYVGLDEAMLNPQDPQVQADIQQFVEEFNQRQRASEEPSFSREMRFRTEELSPYLQKKGMNETEALTWILTNLTIQMTKGENPQVTLTFNPTPVDLPKPKVQPWQGRPFRGPFNGDVAMTAKADKAMLTTTLGKNESAPFDLAEEDSFTLTIGNEEVVFQRQNGRIIFNRQGSINIRTAPTRYTLNGYSLDISQTKTGFEIKNVGSVEVSIGVPYESKPEVEEDDGLIKLKDPATLSKASSDQRQRIAQLIVAWTEEFNSRPSNGRQLLEEQVREAFRLFLKGKLYAEIKPLEEKSLKGQPDWYINSMAIVSAGEWYANTNVTVGSDGRITVQPPGLGSIEQAVSSGGVADPAALTPGGIDLNSNNMQMDIDGQKIDIKFDPAMIEQFKRGDFTGVQPIILNITPIPSIAPLLGLASRKEEVLS